MASNGATFVRVTNRDIYDRLGKVEAKLDAYMKKNDVDHEHFRGQIRLNWWAVAGLGVLIGTLATLVIAHLFGIGI